MSADAGSTINENRFLRANALTQSPPALSNAVRSFQSKKRCKSKFVSTCTVNILISYNPLIDYTEIWVRQHKPGEYQDIISTPRIGTVLMFREKVLTAIAVVLSEILFIISYFPSRVNMRKVYLAILGAKLSFYSPEPFQFNQHKKRSVRLIFDLQFPQTCIIAERPSQRPSSIMALLPHSILQ